MSDRANPAVIIGLGGTGTWVLTYIKKNLLDTYGGKMPPTIRLLSFDTTTEKVSRAGIAQEVEARVGDVQLDLGSEFVYLGGNIQDIARDIRNHNAYPHIGSWFQASTYLQTADRDSFNIAHGAGQKRPFGRMALFYNLQKSVQAEITNKISTAISEVIGANERQGSIEIYVVASLAGGTGGGMFIDIAHLTRWLADRKIRTGYAVRGFLALQNAFRSMVRVEQMEANTFAAMRELDRFMLVFDQQYPIVYNPTNPVLNTIYGGELGKLFDNCYLLDASRQSFPLDAFAPQYGVYHSMADCISMLLDTSTGDAFAQHYKNVNTRLGEVQSQLKQPLYSSLGTYSLILPVEDIIISLTHRFAIELLAGHLLNLDYRTSGSGQMQYLLRYKGNAREDAAAFLRATRGVTGIESTTFIQRVPLTVDQYNTKNEVYIQEIANLDAAELLTWVLPPESDPTIRERTRNMRKDLETRLSLFVWPSNIQGDGYIEGCSRIIRHVRDFKEEFLGRDVGGRPTGGLYHNALNQCMALHNDRYRTFLQEHLLILLNGPAPENKDYQHEKCGKLGQAQTFLSHLIQYFMEQTEFFQRVREQRARIRSNELRQAQEAASRARSDMEDKKTRGSLLGAFVKDLHPAVRTQQAYLDAEQHLIDIEVTDVFFDFLLQTSEALRRVTGEFKSSIDNWINTLTIGLTGPVNDLGLYRALQMSASRHEANREDKKRIVVHEYLTDPDYELSLYHEITAGKFAEAMTRLTWSVDPQSPSFRLELSGCTIVSNDPTDGRSATNRNMDFFLGIAHDYFAPLRNLTIADRLVERDALPLAANLLDHCGPMIRYDPSKAGGAQELHYFVCVNEGRQKAYFNELRNVLRRLGASAKDNHLLVSSNPYVCTILATADVIASQGLHAYISAERTYNSYAGDARLLHIFPAEVNAVYLEQQLPKIKEPRRRFSYELTAMLEDPELVEQFILAYLYGYIHVEQSEGSNNRWVLQLPAARRRNPEIYLLTKAEPRPSLFEAMQTFVFRKSDINNASYTIDFEQLRQQLRWYEYQASSDNESRLINLLDMIVDRDIEPLRRDPNSNYRDVGSLMRLVVDRITDGLFTRIEARGQVYDRQAMPLIGHDISLDNEVSRFLKDAGFSVTPVERYGLICTSQLPLWKDISPLYVQLVLERTLDLIEFKSLFEVVERIYDMNVDGRTAVVVIDHPPEAGDLYQIFALRAKRNLTIVPLPKSIIIQARIDRREPGDVLLEQFDLYAGRSDLYNVSTAVTDVLSFFGRTPLLMRLQQGLTHGKPIMLYGLRKVGKSSLINRLQEECTWPMAIVDLQGYGQGLETAYYDAVESWKYILQTTDPSFPLRTTVDDVVFEELTELVMEGFMSESMLEKYKDRQANRNPTRRADVTASRKYSAQTFRKKVVELLGYLDDQPGQPGLILVLDEMDLLINHPDYFNFASVLRALAEDARYRGRFTIMMTGLEPALNRLDWISGGHNPFFSFFEEHPVGPLVSQDVREMIVSIGGQMGVKYSDSALDMLVNIGGGHPFLTRQLCSLCTRTLERPVVVDLAQTLNAINTYLADPRSYLAMSLWGADSQGPPECEVILLSLLAKEQPQRTEALVPHEFSLVEQRERHVALYRLRDQGLLYEEDGLWHMTIPLYREWIRRSVLMLPSEMLLIKDVKHDHE